MTKHIATAHAASQKIADNDQSDSAVEALGNGVSVADTMKKFPDANWQEIADFAALIGDPTDPRKHTVADQISQALTKKAA